MPRGRQLHKGCACRESPNNAPEVFAEMAALETAASLEALAPC